MYRTLFYNRWKFDSPPPPPPPPFARLRTLSPCSGFLLFLGKIRPPSASPLLIVCLSVCLHGTAASLYRFLARSVGRSACCYLFAIVRWRVSTQAESPVLVLLCSFGSICTLLHISLDFVFTVRRRENSTLRGRCGRKFQPRQECGVHCCSRQTSPSAHSSGH
jgi:hypothetical protein